MPTYEYRCAKCAGRFEAFQRINDKPLTRCQVCGAEGAVKRLVGMGAGLIFKGSGFYITDYKKSNSSPSPTSTGSSDSSESSDKKSDSNGKTAKDKESTPAKPSTAKE
jgi:putative FmdB family regulatory protein